MGHEDAERPRSRAASPSAGSAGCRAAARRTGAACGSRSATAYAGRRRSACARGVRMARLPRTARDRGARRAGVLSPRRRSDHRDYPVIGDALTYHLRGARSPRPRVEGFTRAAPSRTGPARRPSTRRCSSLLIGALHAARRRRLPGPEAPALPRRHGHRRVRRAARRARVAGRAGRPRRRRRSPRVYPFLWVADGSLMSETLYGALLAAVAAGCATLLRRAAPCGRVAVLGALIALAALTRGEALLLVPLLLLPLVARGSAAGARAARAPRRARRRPSRSCSRRGRSAT